jgi:hypothetical protein
VNEKAIILFYTSQSLDQFQDNNAKQSFIQDRKNSFKKGYQALPSGSISPIRKGG